MKKKITSILSLISILLFISSAMAGEIPNAKGSSAITSNVLLEATDMTHSWDPVLSTIIQVASQKELVFDVALQCGLYTDTLVRSKGGTKDTSTAEVAIDVRVKLQKLNNDGTLGVPKLAYPEHVIYAKRAQTLMAKFQGIFQKCEEEVLVIDPYNPDELRVECVRYSTDTCLNVEGVDDNGDGVHDRYVTTVDLECLDDEEVQLILDTINANAFNFISPNLEQGEYKVTVEAEITSDTSSTNGGAMAKGLVGMGSMVVDEVRFIKKDNGTGM
jgi:hypothetical protein